MKFKKLFLTTLFLASATFAHATDYYFSSSTGNNANICSQASPCRDFKGKGLNGVNALLPGDRVFFKRGDEWYASQAEVEVNSNGTGTNETATNPIILDAYGTGAKPTFIGASGVTTGWVQHSGTIWKKVGVGAQEVKTVGVDRTEALCVYWGTNTTLLPGTFNYDYSNTVYVRLFDDSNPNNHQMFVSQYKHNNGNGDKGLVRSVSSSTGLRGHYIHFKNLSIMYSNGVGWSASGKGNQYHNIDVLGSAGDGVLFWKWDVASSRTNNYKEDSNSDYGRMFGGKITYNTTFGSGYGQAVTVDSSYVWIYGVEVYNNFMAGVDFLEYWLQSDVGFGGVVNSTIYNNGILSKGTSYDPNIYIDGSHHMFVANNIVHSSGVDSKAGPCGTYSAGACSNNLAKNSRGGIAWGSEHPISNVTTDVYIINNLVSNINWIALDSNHANCYGSLTECPPDGNTKPTNIKNVWIINNTVAAKDDSTQNSSFVWDTSQADTATANNWVVKNNIFIADNSMAVNPYFSTSNLSYLDTNYNLYYRRGQTSSAILYGGSTTLAGMQALSKELNSIYGNPYVVLDSDINFDGHLQRTATGHANTSPAIDTGLENAFTPPNWIPSDIQALIGTGVVQGTTRTDNVPDDVFTNIDIGFHYPITTIDTTAPSTPTNLQGSATSDTQISLTWTASSDNVGVAGYQVYKNGILEGTTSVANYVVSGLTASTQYTFYVRAYDATPNYSGNSTSVAVTTNASTTIQPATNLVATVNTGPSVGLTWTASPSSVTGYYIFRNSSNIGNTASTSYTDSTVVVGQTYSYQVQAYNGTNTSSLSNTQTVNIPSGQGTLTSTNVQPASLVANAVGNISIYFTTQNSWDANGKIQITFPTSLGNGFSFNSGGTTVASSLSGINGTLTVDSVSGNVITLSRGGGATISTAGAKSFVLNYIKNPNISGSTGLYGIETQKNDSTYIDRDNSVTADLISTETSGQFNFENITFEGITVN
jgi:hypothetical protein